MRHTWLLLLLVGCNQESTLESKCDDRTVTKIGGCDEYGLCAVRLSDGSKAMMDMPLEGDIYCERIWKRKDK